MEVHCNSVMETFYCVYNNIFLQVIKVQNVTIRTILVNKTNKKGKHNFCKITAYALDIIQSKHLQIAIILCQYFKIIAFIL